MAVVGIHNHRGTLDFSIFKMKNLDVKFLLEQSHSKFYLPYHNLQQLRKESCFCNPQVCSFRMRHFSQQIKSWVTLSYSLGIDEL